MAPTATAATAATPGADAAALRKAAIEACRAAVLTCHAAAGLCRDARLCSSERAARCAEGLLRSAVAVAFAPASPTPPAPRRASTPGPAAEEKTGNGKGKAKDKSKDKSKANENKDDSKDESPAQPRRPKRQRGRALRADAAPFEPVMELDDDSWADGAVVFGPAAAPPDWPPRVELPGSAPADPGRLPLVPRRASRSPRRPSPSSSAPLAAGAATPKLALLAGRVAAIGVLESRPDLRNSLVVLSEFDEKSGRWLCLLKGGDCLRILPSKLKPLAESAQKFSRLRYETT